MGFLKFLKKEKKDTLDELDLPPAPPPLEGFEKDLPELPEFPDFPEEKISAPEELPKFDFSEEEPPELGKKDTMPDFTSFPEIEEKPLTIPPVGAPPTISEPLPSIPKQMPEHAVQKEVNIIPSDVYPKIERRIFPKEKRFLGERPSWKTIYLRVDRFKATLGSINIIRSDLRKSEEALMKLENIKNVKDKSFDKVRASLDDLQKKLIFVDRTLFKGE